MLLHITIICDLISKICKWFRSYNYACRLQICHICLIRFCCMYFSTLKQKKGKEKSRKNIERKCIFQSARCSPAPFLFAKCKYFENLTPRCNLLCFTCSRTVLLEGFWVEIVTILFWKRLHVGKTMLIVKDYLCTLKLALKEFW